VDSLIELWFIGMIAMGIAGAFIVLQAIWRNRSKR
jgi:hypothetical protein